MKLKMFPGNENDELVENKDESSGSGLFQKNGAVSDSDQLVTESGVKKLCFYGKKCKGKYKQ